MQQHTHKRLYNWHSLGGIIASLLFAVITATAIPVIFLDELRHWLVDEVPLTTTTDVNQWLEHANRQFDLAEDEFFISFGQSENALPTLWIPEHDHDHKAWRLTETGDFAHQPQLEALDIIGQAHYNLLIPDPWGEYIVGLIGLLSLALIIAGVFLHQKWFSEKYQMRKSRSRRLLMSDMHKLVGLWLLPFHVAIAYTGAVLGLGSLLIIVAAYSAFGGDQEAAIEAVLGEHPVKSEQQCEMQPFDEMLARSDAHWLEKYERVKPLMVEIHYYGDCNGQITITSAVPGYLFSSNSLTYMLTTGELVKEIDWVTGGFGERWYALIGPLHFGDFAGLTSKIAYAVSAILLLALIAAGVFLWADKRAQKGASFSQALAANWCSNLLICLLAGVTVATLTTLIIARWFYGLLPTSADIDPWLIVYLAGFASGMLICRLWISWATKPAVSAKTAKV